MKIVVLDMFTLTNGDIDWDAFRALGEVTIYENTSPDQRAERIGNAEIALSNRTPIDRATMERCPNLRYIGMFATGVNLIDTEAAKERGIAVTNVPGYSTAAVTQLTLAFILEFCCRVGSFDAGIKAGRWTLEKGSCFWDHPLIELDGLTLGLVGFGNIGSSVANVATALGMKVLAHRRRADAPPTNPGVKYAPLDEVLSGSDILSLHAPLTPETKGIINKDSIAKMKDGAIVVNTARGALIEEADVAAALKSGKLRGYGADVFSAEPLPAGNPLYAAPNCLLTPHVGWAPFATRVRLFDEVAKNLKAFLDGKPRNVVNP